jgi:hypothetical protein
MLLLSESPSLCRDKFNFCFPAPASLVVSRIGYSDSHQESTLLLSNTYLDPPSITRTSSITTEDFHELGVLILYHFPASPQLLV